MPNSFSWNSILKKVAFILLTVVAVLFLYSLIGSSVTKNIDTYTYNLPFEERTKHRIVQSYGGLFSHINSAAVDFDMPEGTPVCAAREGVIYTFKDDSDKGGPLPFYEKKANFIIIKHNDGSFGCYWHLKNSGVLVKNGFVAKGQRIGFSGSTGFTVRPHLHFSVKLKLNYEKDSYVRTKFKTTNGIEFLEYGELYERPVN